MHMMQDILWQQKDGDDDDEDDDGDDDGDDESGVSASVRFGF